MTQVRIENKLGFVNNFLGPISKLAENTVLKVRKDSINSVSSSSDGTLIVNCIAKQPNDTNETIYLNVPDINRLIKVLSCVTDDNLTLTYTGNSIDYKSDTVGFKYHLLEDGIIDPPRVDISKIKKIEFNTSFEIDVNSINQLIKASTFTADTNKIYFYTEGDKVYATLTDKQRHNVDSYTQIISETRTGDEILTPLALSFETVRIISSIRVDNVTIHVNSKLNVFLFQIDTESANITIVSSGFVG